MVYANAIMAGKAIIVPRMCHVTKLTIALTLIMVCALERISVNVLRVTRASTVIQLFRVHLSHNVQVIT